MSQSPGFAGRRLVLGALAWALLSPTALGAPVVVRYAVVGSTQELAGYQAIVDRFNQIQRDVRVELEINSGSWTGHREKVLTEILGGSAPDVVRLDEALFQEFAHTGLLTSLQPYIKRDGVRLDAFFPRPLPLYQYKGELYGFPLGIKVHNTFLNQDLFDRFGLAYPDKSWQWQREFTDVAKKLTQGTGSSQTWGLGFSWTFKYLVDTIWSFGGEVFNSDFTQSTLNHPATVEAIQTLLDLQHGLRVAPPTGVTERFLEGRLGIWVIGIWETPRVAQEAKFRWDIGHKPAGPAGLVGILRGSAYTLLNASRNKEAAWQFIKFAMSEEGQKVAADNLVEGVPMMRSVVRRFLEAPGQPKNATVFLEAMEYGRPYVVPASMTRIEQILNQGLRELQNGQLSARQFAERYVPAVNAVLQGAPR